MKNRLLRVSSIVPVSEANGPGPHYSIWVQGCSLKCKNCFNPQTHDPTKGKLIPIPILISDIRNKWESGLIRGVTITGGEPLDQLHEIIDLVSEIKRIGDIGIIVFSGYEEDELNKKANFSILCNFIDILIIGRFKYDQKIQKALRGSRNKRYIINSLFYSLHEFDSIPQVEVTIRNNGSLTISGIKPEIVKDELVPINKN